jgi:hypothetical protein
MAFTKTKNYNPYQNSNKEYKEIQSFIGVGEYQKALKVTKDIQDKNFTDIPSHLYASYIFEKLNNKAESRFHSKIFDGLLMSILKSGSGKDKRNAFIVITVAEEYDFLSWLNMKTKEQSLVKEDGFRFDVLRVVDKRTQKESDMYFNVHLVFAHLNNMFKK